MTFGFRNIFEIGSIYVNIEHNLSGVLGQDGKNKGLMMKMNILFLFVGCMLMCTLDARKMNVCSVEVTAAKNGENGSPHFYEDGEAGKNGLNGGNGGNGGSSITGKGGNGGNGGDAD